jgi:hypothetical protein
MIAYKWSYLPAGILLDTPGTLACSDTSGALISVVLLWYGCSDAWNGISSSRVVVDVWSWLIELDSFGDFKIECHSNTSTVVPRRQSNSRKPQKTLELGIENASILFLNRWISFGINVPQMMNNHRKYTVVASVAQLVRGLYRNRRAAVSIPASEGL